MSQENPIGEFLRARRELVGPEDVGISDRAGRRRVAGLRREEVAMLAGVSSDYYVRLEQGRDQHPSQQVLDALARALQLDDDATVYLHRLANAPTRRRRKTTSRPAKVPAGILQLMVSWSQAPAYVQSRYMDVLVATPLATAVAPYVTTGNNLVLAAFVDTRVRELHGDADWESHTESMVAGLRALVGPDIDDPRLNELVGELSVRSERFRWLWARHDVRHRNRGTTQIEHPLVGPLELTYEKLQIPETDGQTLVIYQAAPGSASAQALALLSASAAEDREPLRSAQTD